METWNHGVKSCGRPSRTEFRKGCRCYECRMTESLARKRRRLAVARGTADHLVDAGRAREKLIQLQEQGYTDKEIVNCGIDNHTIFFIRSGRRTRIYASTEARILAISERRPTRNQRLETEGLTALIRSWKDAGISYAQIAKATGVSATTISRIARGIGRTYAHTAVQIASSRADVESLLVGNGKGRGTYSRVLSDCEVEEIVTRHRHGEKSAILAAEYGTEVSAITRAILSYATTNEKKARRG